MLRPQMHRAAGEGGRRHVLGSVLSSIRVADSAFRGREVKCSAAPAVLKG